MRLLLDEHISPVVAEQLRKRGHDVVAISELGLQGASDEVVLDRATKERRAVVTNNIRDFQLLHARLLTSSAAHYGIVLVSRSSELSKKSTGSLVKALDRVLKANPTEGALRDRLLFI